MAPRIPDEDARQGRRNALRHPLERRKILAACKRVTLRYQGLPLTARLRLFWARLRLFWVADVLLWEDRAFVRGIGYFDAHRDADGTWHATQMMF